MESAAAVVKALKAKSRKSEIENVKSFFRGPRRDSKCLGVPMREVFAIAKRHQKLPLDEIKKLLKSTVYEIRMSAVSIMDFRARDKRISSEEQKALCQLYLTKHDRINNWDLVDRAAPHVVGAYLFKRSRAPLYKLVKSRDPWRRRTAIVSTYYFIKNGDIEETFEIASHLVNDKDVYVQKAVGSWVREAGKQSKGRLLQFLDEHSSSLTSETIRLATEKLSSAEKARYRRSRANMSASLA